MKRRNILVCDDEEGVRESYNLILERDYNVAFAASAQEAIDHVRNNLTDVVILDIKMPKMNGIEALKEIKKINPNVEVIIATGYKSVETAAEACKHGASDYIVKPFESAQVLKLVDRALQSKK